MDGIGNISDQKNTSGVTINFIRFKKMVPKGLMYETAKDEKPVMASMIPVMIPSARAIKIMSARGIFYRFSFS